MEESGNCGRMATLPAAGLQRTNFSANSRDKINYWSPVRIREGGHAAALAQWQSSRLTASPKFKKSLSGEALVDLRMTNDDLRIKSKRFMSILKQTVTSANEWAA